MSAGLRELARLLGGGASHSKFYSIPCPAHNDAKPSASIRLGNDGKLRARCFAGCREQVVLAEISRQAGMIRPDGSFMVAPAQAREPPADNVEAEIEEAKRAAEVQERAQAIWAKARPAGHSLVAHYLYDTRGLELPHIPAAIRFCPSLPHGWSRSKWPAMVAKVVDTNGGFCGLHRTWLHPITAAKAAIERNRAALGPIKGGAIRLWDVSESSDLLVAEGIETTLAAAQVARWRYPAWAAISAPGMMALDVPRYFKRVIIAADNDEVGTKAAHILAHRLRKRGLHVAIKAPPIAGEDWNDHLLTQQRAARQERAT